MSAPHCRRLLRLACGSDLNLCSCPAAAALEHLIRLRIQTRDDTTPMEVLNDAVNALILEVNKMEDQFADQVEEYKANNPQDM